MAEKKKKTFKLDIFRVLKEADLGNKSFYSSLTDEEKKAFSPLVIMKWLSGVGNDSGDQHNFIVLTNDMLNKDLWELEPKVTEGRPGHHELQWLLMCVVGDLIRSISGSNREVRHQWVPLAHQKKKSNEVDELLYQVYPGMNAQELELIKKINKPAQIEELAKRSGMQDKGAKKIKAEFQKWRQANK